MTNGKKRPSGSENRQRNKQSCVRWLDGEFEEAAARAHAAGLSLGAYLRAAALRPPATEERDRSGP